MSINCPICFFDKNEKITLLSNNMKVMGDTFPSAPASIVSCKRCGAVYIDTKAQQSHYSNYYNSGYSKTISYIEVFGEKTTKEYFNNIYNSFCEYITKDSKILDVGAGRGEFSKYLKDLGYKNIIAMEPSLDNYEHIIDNGIECMYSDIFNMKVSEKFDLIILSHTLEHILDFKIALKKLKLFLKEDGIIYIEVPDSEKYTKVNFPSYFFFTFEHIIHFTQKDFKNLANSYGFELLKNNEYLKCNSYFVMNGIFKNNGKLSGTIYNNDTKTAIKDYLEYSKKKLLPVIKGLEESKEKLILWGIGASTAQLLNETFNNCNVIQLIDNNSSRQGIEFIISNKKFIIESPDDVCDVEATIIILPIMYKKSIIEQIKSLGFKNKIMTLE